MPRFALKQAQRGKAFFLRHQTQIDRRVTAILAKIQICKPFLRRGHHHMARDEVAQKGQLSVKEVADSR